MKRTADNDTDLLLEAENKEPAELVSLKVSSSDSNTIIMPAWRESKWPFIVNLSNSIIGVSILAMPFCLQQCGVLLGLLILMGCSLLTRFTCHLLMRGAHLARRRSYEALAQHVFGPTGKRLVEIAMILFIMSTLCAFFVVIGDLGPHVLADYLQLEAPTQRLRIFVIMATALFFILPLSLLRNVDSLSAISSLAILFYGVFVLRMLAECLPRLLAMQWVYEVNWWRTEGILQCLPIFAMALSCQTQLFIVAECIDDVTPLKMDEIIKSAVNLCTLFYGSVGFLGYVAFHEHTMHGDILVYLDASFLTQLLKLGFMLSVAVSFPLMLFPCRSAIFNILFRPTPQASGDFQVDVMPQAPFQVLTLAILTLNLFVAVMLPNVEFVLGLTGSLIGSTVCTIFPALMFILIAPKHHKWTYLGAKIALVIGLFMLVACTFKTLQSKPVDVIIDQPVPKVIDSHKNFPHQELPDVPKASADSETTTTPVKNKAPPDKESPEVVERLEPVLPDEPAKSEKAANDAAAKPTKIDVEVKPQEIGDPAKNSHDENEKDDNKVEQDVERLKRQINESVTTVADMNDTVKGKEY